MIIRHHRIIHPAPESPRQPLTPAGRFWVPYLGAVVLIALWVLA